MNCLGCCCLCLFVVIYLDRDIPPLAKEQCECIAASSFRIKSHTVWYECNWRNYNYILSNISCLNYVRAIQRTV